MFFNLQDIIKLLQENGANVNIENKSGESVLIMSDVSEEIKALLKGK
jgi:ankyrin repeat protein